MEKINKFMNDSQTYDEFNNDIDKKLKEEDFLGALKICGEAQKIFRTNLTLNSCLAYVTKVLMMMKKLKNFF